MRSHEPAPDHNSEDSAETVVSDLEIQFVAAFRKLLCLNKPDISINERCTVAVSGGPDSVAMLHLLKRCFPHLVICVAHMNHHARVGADADEAFIKQLAAELSLPIEVGHWRATRSAHFEDDARRARHEWLEQVAVKNQSRWILTAHTLDDQAETLLLRMIRGTGPHGLSGIRPVRKLANVDISLARPLLGFSKSQLLEYLRHNNLGYCTDPTNQDTGHQSRAWVRHILVPQIEQRLNPMMKKSLGQLAELSAEEQDGLDELARELFSGVARVCSQSDSITIDAAEFAHVSHNWLRRRWLRLAWTSLHWPMRSLTMQHWQELERRICEPSPDDHFPWQLPGFVRVGRCADKVMIERVIASEQESEHPGENPAAYHIRGILWDWPGDVETDDLRIRSSAISNGISIETLKIMNPRTEAVVDAQKITPPVLLRHPQPGDEFDPLGMRGHSQKLVDFLRIQHIPAAEKSKIWVACDKSGIFWVVGHRIAERVKCTPETQHAWHLSHAEMVE